MCCCDFGDSATEVKVVALEAAPHLSPEGPFCSSYPLVLPPDLTSLLLLDLLSVISSN